MSNIVAIVGRPNVGKSTFFNRLIEERQAIVDEEAGVTRDRHYGQSTWNGKDFSVIDTGGYVFGSNDVFESEIRKQVELAIDEADVIILMVDVKDGLTELDKDVAQLLRRSKKKVFLAANKVDNTNRAQDINEFYMLGLGEIYGISAMSGSGTGDLLDEVVRDFEIEVFEETENLPRIAVVGKPNVGKSSMINTLIGTERNIVTPVAGTTRDTIHTRYKSFGFNFYLIDTAGLRKKAKVTEDIEFYSVLRSIRAIEHSDVCLVMVDATEGFDSQDMNIFRLAQRNHKGIVIVVNKWDLVEKNANTHLAFEKQIRDKIAPFIDVPIVFTSVTEKQRVHKALEMAQQVFENRSTKITTSKLNEFLLPVLQSNPPPAVKGKYVKVKYINQLPMHYPAFAFFCNLPQYIREPYKRFLENKIRQQFNFTGVPMEIYFRLK